LSPPPTPPARRSAAVPFFAASSTADDLDLAPDAIADSASAAVARHFRKRYADLPRIIRESRSPGDLMESIRDALQYPAAFDPVAETLSANVLNAVE